MKNLNFKDMEGNRYWWSKIPGSNYVPPIYSFLSNTEWNILEEWYKETDEKKLIGECNIPFMSLVLGFITGNIIQRIVQCGTYSGYSTLLIGFMLRMMGHKKSIITIDNNEATNIFTKQYINKAELNDYVHIMTSDSSDLALPTYCSKYLEGSPQLVIIDSSHQYTHTLKELDLWYAALQKNGFILLHDTSLKASLFDNNQNGGVKKAIEDWEDNNKTPFININSTITASATVQDLVYTDGCGIGIIQKIC